MEGGGDILDISKIHLEGDFDVQLQQLLSAVRLTRNEVENLEELIKDLNDLFGRHWPGCKIHPFGSIVMGLGIRTSDIDCFISIPYGVLPAPKKLVQKARVVLMKRPDKFAEITCIPQARVPIVKFYHLPTDRNCDVNFNSLAGVQNSRLLAYLLKVDSRALPLAIVIKYWSKVHKLTGTNLLSNYGLTLMVIFYLQHVNILPPVHLLQPPECEYIVDGWNTGFMEMEFRNSDNLTVYQLLGGFFDFYNNFDFNKKMICPYLGCQIDIVCFNRLEDVPKEFVLYKKNVGDGMLRRFPTNVELCIQDPFEHCRNCGVQVRGKIFTILEHSFKTAAKIFYDLDPAEFLKELLTRSHKLEISRGMHSHKVEKRKDRSNLHHNLTRNIHQIYRDYKKRNK